MLPLNKLSTEPVRGDYLRPDDRSILNPLEDWELGGVGLQDPSQGLQVKVWHAYALSDGTVILEAPGVTPTALYQEEGISEINFCFDQNMNSFLAFVVNGVVKFRWYDSTILDYTITTLPDALTPKCCLDDKREQALATSDIILAYVLNNNLYFRAQRDRYTIEYLLKANVDGLLEKIGMTDKLRVQFQLKLVA